MAWDWLESAYSKTLGAVPVVGDALDTVGGYLGMGGPSAEEQAQQEAQQAALDAILGVSAPPTQNELMGLGAYGGQMPDDYYDQYLQQLYGSYTSGGGGTSEGVPLTRSPQGTWADFSGDSVYTTEYDRSNLANIDPSRIGTATTRPMDEGVISPRDRMPVEEGMAALGSRDNPIRNYDSWLEGQDQDALLQQAQRQWLQEQVAADPFFGLQQYGRPEMADAAADPHSIEMQRRALDQFANIYAQGGYTEAERAQNRLAQMDAARFEQSQRGAIEQQAAMRGMGNSGTSLASMLSAQQGGANRAAESADRFTIAGQQRALQALANQGQLAGQIRGQSWGEDTARRSAVDRWNWANTDLRNAWTAQRGQAAQQAWGNEANLAGMQANAQLGYGNYQGGVQAAHDAQDAQLLNTGLAVGSTYLTGSPAAGQAIAGSTTQQSQTPDYWTDLSGGNTGLYR